jgi:hypothetical protein
VLILGLLNQLSRAARETFERRDNTTRLGSGLMGGGVVLASLSASNFVAQLYIPESGWYAPLSFAFVLIGVTMMLVGMFLLLKTKAKPK